MTTPRLRSGSNTPALTLEDLKAALAVQREDIIDNLSNKIDELKQIIELQAAKIKTLENHVGLQEIKLAQLDNLTRKEFSIIHGIPEDAIVEDTLKKLKLVDIDKEYTPFRLGKKRDEGCRPIKIKFKTEKQKINLTKSANDVIRLSPDEFKDIYINYDQSPLHRSENARLRLVKNDLKNKNPGATVRILKGQVILNDTVMDKFDLRKQVFH